MLVSASSSTNALSSFRNSAYRAAVLTSTTVNAGIGIDNIFIITLGNCAYGANSLTASAAYAVIANYTSHKKILQQ